MAQREPDEEHPYGHTCAETVAASNVALLIVVSALYLGWQAIARFGAPLEKIPLWTLWIAAVNVVIKEALYRYKIRVGKRVGSQAIIANAWDHRSDALSALAVLIALALSHWGGPAMRGADSVAALFVVAAVVWTGIMLFRSSASELMDPRAPSDIVERIRQSALGVSGVEGVEKLWVRKSGIEFFADIHVEVDAQLSVAQGHRIGHEVKDVLLDRFDILRDVLVHLEPHEDESISRGAPGNELPRG